MASLGIRSPSVGVSVSRPSAPMKLIGCSWGSERPVVGTSMVMAPWWREPSHDSMADVQVRTGGQTCRELGTKGPVPAGRVDVWLDGEGSFTQPCVQVQRSRSTFLVQFHLFGGCAEAEYEHNLYTG